MSKDNEQQSLSFNASTQNNETISTYVLSCIANSTMCYDDDLWKSESDKIKKALHIDKSEIYFEELGWYFMAKYPALYKFNAELHKDDNLYKASSSLLQLKTIKAAINVGIPSTLILEEDENFQQKSHERHDNFLKFLDIGDPKSMDFSEMIKIPGSLDYMHLHITDRQKHNEFINVGYNMMKDFINGDLPIKKEEVGEAYLFFQSVLDTVLLCDDENLSSKNVLNDCIIPQLENVRLGHPIKKQTEFIKYESTLDTAKDNFNRKFIEDPENKKVQDNNYLEIMKQHTFIDEKKHCHKDKMYYRTLHDKISLKYWEPLHKYEAGIARYEQLGSKVQRVLDKVIDRMMEKNTTGYERNFDRDTR